MDYLFFESALLPDGWATNVRLTVAAGVITSIETDALAGSADERHHLALPGLANLHSHAFQRGMAGLSERRGPTADSFWTWRLIMYRFLAVMEPEDVQAIAAQLYVEMLEAGFTRVGEFHYLHHQADGRPYAAPAHLAEQIAAAAAGTGIGLTLLPVFYAHGDFSGHDPDPGQRRFICDTDSFARLMEESRKAVADLPGSVVGVAPHSLRAVTPEELGRILPLAMDGPIHMHIAEQTREVEACLAWSGQRPVEWLLEHVPVDQRWCLIHATHMTEAETLALARSGAVAGLCPITEANLGDGIFNGPLFHGAGGRFGIGSDSNVLVDLAGELRQFEYAQRLQARARNVIATEADRSTGRALYTAALAGGGQAVGCRMGLEAGASADILAVRLDHPSLAARDGDALLDSLVFACRGLPIDTVWSRGRAVVRQGRHLLRHEVRVRYDATLRKLLACPNP